jgi:hypothetical protein
VHTNPHAIFFVREQVYVVIAAAHGAKLVTRHLLERRNRLQLPGHIIEQGMIYPFVVLAANTEADNRPHVVHDSGDARTQLHAGHIKTHGLVAAADVVANTGRADRILVCHHSADRHTVADMVVGHECDLVGGACTDTNLVQRTIIGLTEHRNLVIEDLHAYHESVPHLLASLLKAKWRQHFLGTNEKAPDHQARGSKVCFGKTRYALVQSSPCTDTTSLCEYGRRPFAL